LSAVEPMSKGLTLFQMRGVDVVDILIRLIDSHGRR